MVSDKIVARKENHPDKNEIIRVADQLRVLIKEERDLHCSTSDEFLMRFIRVGEYDVDRSFRLVKDYFEAKRDMPDAFVVRAPSEYMHTISRLDLGYVCPHTDLNSSRIAYIRVGNVNTDVECWDDIFAACVIVLEALTMHQVVQDNGVELVFDCTNFNINLMRWATPHNVKIVLKIMNECIPLRFQAFHIVNAPMVFNIFYSSIKIFITKQISRKIKWHSRPFKALHQRVGTEILPPHLGGTLTIEQVMDWYHFVHSSEKLFEEIRKMGYIKNFER